MKEFKRESKYLVVKLGDIEEYLIPPDKEALDEMLKMIRAYRVSEGKPKTNSYVVVNEDEPYAEQVWELIQKHWETSQ